MAQGLAFVDRELAWNPWGQISPPPPTQPVEKQPDIFIVIFYSRPLKNLVEPLITVRQTLMLHSVPKVALNAVPVQHSKHSNTHILHLSHS